MKPSIRNRFLASSLPRFLASSLPRFLASSLLVAASSAHADIITKASTTDTSLANGNSWIGGIAPTGDDIAQWVAASGGATGFTTNLVWGAIDFADADTSISSANTLTLNGGQSITTDLATYDDVGIVVRDLTGVGNLTLNPLNLALGADQTWVVEGARNISMSTATNRMLNLGGNTLTFKHSSGSFVAATPNLVFNASISNGTIDFQSGHTVISTNGTASSTIAANATLKLGANALLRLTAGSGTNSVTYNQKTVLDGGKLILGAASQTITLNGATEVTAHSEINTRSGNVTSATFAGAVSGAGNLKLNDSDASAMTLTLTNANTGYSGNWIVGKVDNPAQATTLTVGGADGALGTGSVTLNSNATLNFTRTSGKDFANAIGGTGKITKSGNSTISLSGENTYTGTTTITAGTLLVNGSTHASSAFTVEAPGTLGGTGTVGGTVSVNGTLAPGASIESLSTGAVTFNNNSTFAYELDSTTLTGDLLDINGTLSMANDGSTILTLSDLGFGVLNINDKLTLISYTGPWDGNTFTYLGNTLTDGEAFTLGNNEFVFDYNDTIGGINGGTGTNFVTLTVIPEPAAALLGSLGMLALLRRRRH